MTLWCLFFAMEIMSAIITLNPRACEQDESAYCAKVADEIDVWRQQFCFPDIPAREEAKSRG